MLESLTLKQEKLCDEVAEEYIGKLLGPRPEHMDMGAVKEWLTFVYGLYDMELPAIEVARSPTEAFSLEKKYTGGSTGALDMCGISDAGWVAFYDYFHRIKIMTDDEIKQVHLIRDYIMNIYDSILLDDRAIVIMRPDFIRTDENNVVHCQDGPSVQWADGTMNFHWHGVSVKKEWIMDKELTSNEALGISNAETRRAACEILGWDKILDSLDAKLIDHDANPQIGDLYMVDLPDSPGEKFLKYKCGTGRWFASNVDSSCKTALQAQQWIWQDDEYAPEIRT